MANGPPTQTARSEGEPFEVTRVIVAEKLQELKRRASRKRRWAIFRFLRAMSSLKGATRRCQLPAGSDVRLALDGAGIAHVGGITRCGSPWSCPLCAPMVREHRAGELDVVLSHHLEMGGGAEFVTVTLPHKPGDSLKSLLETVRKGWTSVVATPAWAGRKNSKTGLVDPGLKANLGILGQVKAVEITYGANGWHPHAHVLVVTRRPLTDHQRAEFEDHVYDRWASFVVKAGFARPSRAHGVDVRPVLARESDGGASLARYLCKVEGGWGAGLELARADVKRGRKTSETPWEILERAMTDGDAAALELWHEYEQATRGCRALVWSPGLRATLGAGQEITDEEAATDEPDEVVTEVLVPGEVWVAVVDAGLVPEVLMTFEDHGEAGLWTLLRRLRT